MYNTAYAVYFDHKRRTDPEFRKALKRESKKQAKAAKQEAEALGAQQRMAIRASVEEAKAEGFPTDIEEKEQYFMSEVARGEQIVAEGELYYTFCWNGKEERNRRRVMNGNADDVESIASDPVEAALCFYRALKVYPQPKDLISIYDKTVPKEVLEILAEMIAFDEDLKVGGGSSAPSEEGHGVE